ncbi:MAG: glycosyltransferase, partial [Anaerolineae bacterium]
MRNWLRSFPPASPVIVIPVYNAYEDVLECVESLIKGTPAEVPILVLDDASTDGRIPETLTALSADGRLFYIRKPTNSGFVGTVNLAFTWSVPR